MTAESQRSERDPAEYNEASIGFDYDALDSPEDNIRELLAAGGGAAAIARYFEKRESSGHPTGSALLKLEQLRTLAAMFFDPRSTNPRHWGLARALHIDAVRSLTDEQIGNHCGGVTKAAISKEARHWLTLLQLPPPPTMKSERACAKYRATRLKAKSPPPTSA